MIPIRLSRFILFTMVSVLFPCSAHSEPALIVDGFIDSYVAHQQPDPKTRARSFTTQALYHDEPSLNLAIGGLTLNTDSFRARMAGQWGSSVVANYSAEPDNASQYLQEGYVGYKLAKDLWLDTGIFLSHLGPEGWLSKDNLTYTRSFIAEFSPYYETGMRLSTKLSEKLSGQFLLVRGWQNISQNKRPALGSLLTYHLSESFSLNHSTFLGDEDGTRFFNDVYLKGTLAPNTEFVAAYDVGFQNRAGSPVWWNGGAAVVRQRLSSAIAVSFRAEYFSDHDGIVATPATPQRPFTVTGFSLGLDMTPTERLLVRAEYRPLIASAAIFPRDNDTTDQSHLFVVSVATWVDGISLF